LIKYNHKKMNSINIIRIIKKRMFNNSSNNNIYHKQLRIKIEIFYIKNKN